MEIETMRIKSDPIVGLRESREIGLIVSKQSRMLRLFCYLVDFERAIRRTRTQEGILLEQCKKLLVDGFFREALESRKRDSTPLSHLIHSDYLK
jgi:hypothetical protein